MKILGIDMSISGTGLCLIDHENSSPRPPILETVTETRNVVGWIAQTSVLIHRVVEVIDQHKPDLIAMEDYALGTPNTNNLTRLAEIGGIIKWYARDRGYVMGYGTHRNQAEEALARTNNKEASKLFVMQTVQSMRKFCMGRGNISKDSAYLLHVHKAMQVELGFFDDDNEGEAYMHAWMAGIVLSVMRGKIRFGDLPVCQQDAMIGAYANLPKGMSMTKALKLSEIEKAKLIGI